MRGGEGGGVGKGREVQGEKEGGVGEEGRRKTVF